MPRILRCRLFRDFLFFVAVIVAVWIVATKVSFYAYYEHMRSDHMKDGWAILTISLCLIGVFALVVAILRGLALRREIRRRDEAERDVAWLSTHDNLTRLINREGLAQEAERIRNSSLANQPWAGFSIDIDAFGKVNDALGDDAGDAVLAEIAQRLVQLFPETPVARLGGNEFFAGMQRRTGESCDRMAERIVKLLGQPITVGNDLTVVRVSIGMARYPEDAGNIEQLIRCANTAMRTTKRISDGLPRWFDAAMDAAMARRNQLDKRLRIAVRNAELMPFYQPQVDLIHGRVIGFEALARWRLDGQFVPPDEFIRISEENGLIHDLFNQLLRRAAADACSWPKDVTLAFNLSPLQLRDRFLARRVFDILADTGLVTGRLELEITESALAQDIPAARATLGELRDAGVSLALDDFGTGYSSLSQLAQFKVDKIKIDRSFIRNFQDDDRQAKIVRAMIGLGRGLGLVTLAEGIEEQEQADILKHVGCHIGQGYLYGAAMPFEETLGCLRVHRVDLAG